MSSVPLWCLAAGILALLIGIQALRKGEFPMRMHGTAFPLRGAAGMAWTALFLLFGIVLIGAAVGLWIKR